VSLWPEEPEIHPGEGSTWSSGTIAAFKGDESGPETEPDRPGAGSDGIDLA
jgi:hypothetical protein